MDALVQLLEAVRCVGGYAATDVRLRELGASGPAVKVDFAVDSPICARTSHPAEAA